MLLIRLQCAHDPGTSPSLHVNSTQQPPQLSRAHRQAVMPPGAGHVGQAGSGSEVRLRLRLRGRATQRPPQALSPRAMRIHLVTNLHDRARLQNREHILYSYRTYSLSAFGPFHASNP